MQRKREVDPTHTASLRNLFARKMRVQFRTMLSQIKFAVVTKDIFEHNQDIQTNAIQLPSMDMLKAMNDPERIQAFLNGLKMQQAQGILEYRMYPVNNTFYNPWTDIYLDEAWKTGARRAIQELLIAGMITDERKAQLLPLLDGSTSSSKAQLVYSNAYSELVRIVEDANSKIGISLHQGLLEGFNKNQLFSNISAIIKGPTNDWTRKVFGMYVPSQTRAEILAKTEIVKAHHVSMIEQFRMQGLEEVSFWAEWHTMEDEKVCHQCEAMNGRVFTLSEIENMIPLHPLCRCIAIPIK